MRQNDENKIDFHSVGFPSSKMLWHSFHLFYLEQTIQTELNRVKNPNWPEANQLVIYKCGRGFELGTTMNKSS